MGDMRPVLSCIISYSMIQLTSQHCRMKEFLYAHQSFYQNARCSIPKFEAILESMRPGMDNIQTAADIFRRYWCMSSVGSGGFGVVFKVRDRRNQEKILAMKRITVDLKEGHYGILPSTVREIANLRELYHPNIVYFNHFEILTDGTVYLFFEYVEDDLRHYLKSPAGGKLTIMQIKRLWYQILQAVCYCHQRGIMHRDLKPGNILINKDEDIKIADFGLSKVFRIPVVTLWYKSPELLLNFAYELGIDTWAIGCIFAEIATRMPLFPGDSKFDQLVKIFSILTTPVELVQLATAAPKRAYPVYTVNRLRESFKDAIIGEDGIKIIERLLKYSLQERVSAKLLLKDPYFDDLDKKTLPAGDWDGDLEPHRFNRENCYPKCWKEAE